MTAAAEMLDTHPGDVGLDRELLLACIEACVECAQTCTACADACLAEEVVAHLRRCIRTNLDCADVCEATGRVLTRRTDPDPAVTRAVLEACAAVCRACGDECASHADVHEHCRVCTSTAGCARGRAGAASRPAATCSARWADGKFCRATLLQLP